jgi:hypothetical protein
VKFFWEFEESRGRGTLITQRVRLEGERAGDYLEGMEALRTGIPAGMRSMAQAMVRAANRAASQRPAPDRK